MTHEKKIIHLIKYCEDWLEEYIKNNFNGEYAKTAPKGIILALIESLKQADLDAAFVERCRPRRFDEELPPDNEVDIICVFVSEINVLYTETFRANWVIHRWEKEGYTHWFYPPKLEGMI